jgi:outer membrane receptor protein involved in Fe transport
MFHTSWRSDLARDVGKPSPTSEVKRVSYPEENSHRFNVGFERPGPGSWSRIATSLSWSEYELILAKDRVATNDVPRQLTETEVDARDYELRFEAERPVGPARVVLGANAYGRFGLHAVDRSSDFDLSGQLAVSSSTVSIDSARRDDLGVFVAASRELGRWGLAAGLRGDWVRAKNSSGYFGDDRATDSGASGYLAVSWKLWRELELSAQVARGFRDALLSDRYFRGETGRGFITGNPELEPETSRQIDLAVRYRGRRWQAAGYGYHYLIQDLIERYRVGDDFFFRNRGEAEIHGVELEGSWVLRGGLQLGAGVHWLRGEIVGDGLATDDVPAPGVFVVVRSDPSARWWWMVRGAAVDRDDRPGPTEQEVAGHGVVDATVGWRISNLVTLQLAGRNLFDHSHLASADEDSVLAPGRSVQLSLRGRLDR